MKVARAGQQWVVGQKALWKNTPSRAKSTRVFVQQGGEWMLVHANFAPDPVPRP